MHLLLFHPRTKLRLFFFKNIVLQEATHVIKPKTFVILVVFPLFWIFFSEITNIQDPNFPQEKKSKFGFELELEFFYPTRL